LRAVAFVASSCDISRTSFMARTDEHHPRLSLAASDVRQSVFAALQGRIEAYRARGGELIPLQIGDTHLAPPDGVLDPVTDHTDMSIYGAAAGIAELREALATRRREHGLSVAQGLANVHVGCGCTHALFCAARAVLDPGDEVLVASPYWPLIPGVLKTGGAVPVEVPLSWKLYAEPELDVAAVLDQARTANTRALYLITPNNPDGQVYTQAQLEAVAAFAREHDLWVFADEVYADFVYDGEHVSIANLPGMADRTISSYSMSKSHALAGARIGYVVASERVIAATRRMSNHTVYNVPVPMQRAALRALATGDPWIENAHANYLEARAATAAALDDIGLSYRLPRGGTFFFVDLSERLRGKPLQILLERAIDEGVLLAPGEAFGSAFTNFARLCFTGAPQDRVLEGVSRLGRALESL
jgi:aspartate/methionine/tyrosine aminotransferase